VWLFEKVSKMRGGKRAGAGRKPNVPNRASAQREREAATSGATPRDVLLMSMRSLWALADQNKNNKKAFAHYVRAAAAVAKDAAPYFHPRISTVEQAASASPVKHIIEIIGGLPVGSTPEKPEGTEYSDVPPEEPY
jgi:hypothetical protein